MCRFVCKYHLALQQNNLLVEKFAKPRYMYQDFEKEYS